MVQMKHYTLRLLALVCAIQMVRSEVLISELNADSQGQIDVWEYIELYNNDGSQVSLDNYVIVLYDGSTNRSYAVIPLQGGQVSAFGYYVIGSSIVVPQPDRFLDSDVNILQNGVDAVALYRGGNPSLYSVGMLVTNKYLVDALVYDKRGRRDSYLLDVLIPNGEILDEWARHLQGQDESLSRCQGMDPLMPSQFQLTRLTPGAPNNCTVEPTTAMPSTMPGGFPNLPSFPPDVIDIYPNIIINEFKVDPATGQFIELYDGGVGGVSLDGFIVVLYRGRTEASYGEPMLLTGLMTDEKGYFLIGHSSLLPHLELPRTIRNNRPPNAIALHFDDANNFGPFTPVSGVNLVDAVVYGNSANQEDNAVVNELASGYLPLVQQGNEEGTSFSRCGSSDRLRLDAFTSSTQTPGEDNICSLPAFVINEVNVHVTGRGDTSRQFIEIFDGGVGQQPLDGIVVVLYGGTRSKAYQTIDLNGYSTNGRGFCLVGWSNDTNVDVGLDFDPAVGFLKTNSGAVALHLGSPQRFRGGTVTNYSLIDAVVYGEEPDLDLLHTLMPYQHILNELGGSQSSEDRSISRCSCCQQLNTDSFGVGPTSPGHINTDCLQNGVTHIETIDQYIGLLRINEIRIVNQGLPRGDFVEIYDGGFGGSGMPLDNVVLVLYNSSGRSYYNVELNGYRVDSNGFFVIGPRSVSQSAAVIENNHWFQADSGAVALHKGSAADYPIGVLASSANLLDAVVYGDNNLLLLDAFTPGESYVNYTMTTGDTSILRCYSRDALESLAYSQGASSPGAVNVCPPPPVYINEVNILETSRDMGQYVELSSNGIPRFPLNNLLLIFWKGTDVPVSYRSVGINGKHTDRNGLFLLGYRGLIAPRPDMTPFNRPTNKIKEGNNAISLHQGLKKEDYPSRSPLTSEGLTDVLVYGTEESEAAQHLIDFFQPPSGRQINEVTSWSERDESINRCQDAENRTVFQMAHITPKAHNLCPSRPDARLIINELNLVPSEQFIELWDLGVGFTSLDDFMVVLFGEGDVSYWIIPLSGFATDSMGYFVMGSSSIVPKAHFQFAQGFMRQTYGAVALYRVSSAASFSEGDPPSSQGLIDAIVYTDLDDKPTGLTDVLESNAFDSRELQDSGFALSRCLSRSLLSRRAFVPQPQTPKSLNNCPVFETDVVINEVNVKHPGQSSQKEFIELYDGGIGNVRMLYLTLVLFNGHNGDRSYLTVDLHRKRTDRNGYYVIGGPDVEGANMVIRTKTSAGFFQDGPDAVALYRAPGGAFPYNTVATFRSLVDALVYSTDEGDSDSLVDRLIPGGSLVIENANHATGDETINRCYGNQRLNTDVYSMGLPTPGGANNCSSPTSGIYHDILINEVNVEVSEGGGEFIELSAQGGGARSLTGFLLVLFNGANQDRSYLEVDLSGYSTNVGGFFVVGTSSVDPPPDIIVHANFLQNGPDAVALYHAPARLFPRGTIATSINLVDVLVYGASSGTGNGGTLLAKLAPGQRLPSEYATSMDGDESLSRCLNNQAKMLSSFLIGPATPGNPNVCIGTPVVINEVKLDGSTVAFIELYDGGRGSTPLDFLSVLLYDSSDNGIRLYSTQSLLGKSTNRDGFFVYGKPSSLWSVDLAVSSSLENFLHSGDSSGVALYRDEVKGSYTDQSVLVDAVVYGSRNPSNMALIDVLIPGQNQVPIGVDFTQGDLSISRCLCCVPLQSVAFALTQPTPSQENGCIAPTKGTTPTEIIINEVSPWTGGAEYAEYIELRGPPGATLQDLTLVLASSTKAGPVYYFALPLRQWSIASDGVFVVGSGSVSPRPDAVLSQTPGAVIRPGEGAVAIYRSSETQFREGAPVTSVNLIDALVYSNLSSQSSAQLTSILTPGFDSISTKYLSSLTVMTSPSLSRCDCCTHPDPSAFTLSVKTPGHTNRCPSRTFKRSIQLHILDAAYEVWASNPQILTDLRQQIVRGVNAECKCGFTYIYLKDEKLLNGSVIYQAEMYALSSGHSKLLYDSYVSFVSKTDKLKILGTDFHIDKTCFSDCLSGGEISPSNPKGQTGAQGGSAAVPVAIVVTVIVIVAVMAVMFYLYLQHRRGSLSISRKRMKTTSGTEGEFQVPSQSPFGNLDVLGMVTENQNTSDFFANPVYMYQSPKAPDAQPKLTVQAGQQGNGAGTKKTGGGGGSDHADGESATVPNGVQS